MPDLHGWITQQIDKVEHAAKAARGQGEGRWRHETGYHSGRVEDERGETVVYDEGAPLEEEAAHIALHDPAAVLRRCAADRRILAIHAPQGGDWEPYACEGCGSDSEYGVLVDHTNDCPTLLALAEGYGLTEEERAALDRPEPEPRQRRMGGFLSAGIAEAMYGKLWAQVIGVRPVEPRPEVKALEILEPHLKKIPGYVPTSEETDGRLVLNDRGDDAAIERRTVPLLVEPPAWWEPYEKPTRATLLSAVERVRALHVRNEHTGDCEHCSERDYPDYAVPWPCPTIRALDGEQP